MSKYNYLTHEGYERLKAELDEMKTNGRLEVARAIAEAREKGDLSENAEYDAAKDAQGMLEMKINEHERALANAKIIDESQLDTSKVTVLSRVHLMNHKLKKEQEYLIVSESEADLKLNKISINSPIGQGLLGRKKGDKVEISTPAGVMVLEILNISLG
ncbi:MAG: transcription elongation factor GreA [Saprospiraceae bacterium]|jgi:transcription elongation factor GreA|nr:transcription elongation factor GreA [Saprospiraceae bacterium]MBL0294081.1 transcription elongation factor GreA [Saprospiraceae bacterium]